MQLLSKLAFAALAITVSLAQAQAADAPGKKGARPGPGGGGDFRAKLMEKFDTNKDGQLSDAEKQAARAEFEKRKGEFGKGGPGGPGKGAPGRGFGKGGPGGKGGFDREALMKRLDKNGDGKLDDAEKQAAREAFGKKRAEK